MDYGGCDAVEHFSAHPLQLLFIGLSYARKPRKPRVCVLRWLKYIVFVKGKLHKKKVKKLTSVSLMYVCVAENAELLVFFTFFLHLSHRQFSFIDLCLSSKMY